MDTTTTTENAPPAPQPAAASPPQVNRWIITVAVTVGTLMGAIDTSIVNVALPDIQSAFGVTIDQVAWISTGYLISLVIIMPLTAWLASMFGRKRVYMSCLAIFITSSIFCGNAPSFLILILFRSLQGLGAGALQPTEQAILRETFPVEEQGMAMALYGLAVMIGPAVGPTMGGWLIENYSWHWIFFINVPIGIVGLLMVWRFVHDPPQYQTRSVMKIDYVGIGLLMAGLASLQITLEQGQQNDWFESNLIVWLTIIAVVALTSFIYWELRTDHPAVDLRLLKNLSFTSGTMIGGVLGISLYSGMFLLPLFMQDLMNYTALQSGYALMPRALTMMAFMPVMGFLFNRLGARKMVAMGLLVSAYAVWMMSSFTDQSSLWQLMIPQMVQGLGFSMIFVALSTAALATVPREKMTNATGTYNLIRQLGGSFGIAAFATLLEDSIRARHTHLINYANPYRFAFQQRLSILQHYFVSMGSDPLTARMRALAMINGSIEKQASVISYEHLFVLSAILLLVCLPMVFTLWDRSKNGKPGGNGQEPLAVEL